MSRAGALVLVGSGVQLRVHMTLDAVERVRRADEVLYLADPATASWLEKLNASSRSLHRHYRPGAPRVEIYHALVEDVLARLRPGRELCVVLPGHPALFSYPTRRLVEHARRDGFAAEVLPGISAEDCLFADLGVDPGETGWQSYEATDLLVHGRTVDPSAALVVWQVSVVGDPRYSPDADGAQLGELVTYLERWYAPDDEVVLYEASPYPLFAPAVERLALRDLADASPGPMATLYVPPAVARAPDAAMQRRLGLDADRLAQ